MRALILAAGFGTRLGSLSDERPKPLLPVCDVPVIRYNLALLEAAGFTEVMVNLHHRGELLEQELGATSGSLRIHYSREPEILGTGGGIKQAAAWLTDGGRERFLVLNGKLVIDLDLAGLLAADPAEGAAATLCVRAVDDPDRWGAVETRGPRVVRIVGKGADGPADAKWMFTGVHVLSPEIVARLPEGFSCIVRQGYIPALAAGTAIAMHRYDGYFEEHSTPARYLAGNFALLSGRARLRHPPAALDGADASARVAPGVTLTAPYRIGPGATVGEGARVGPYAVIGRGAHVAAGAAIERAVVWPDSTAAGEIRDAIVTPRGVVAVEPDPPR